MLDAILDSIPFDLFALDNQGRYVLQNKVCKEHWGDLTGKAPSDAAPDEETLALWEQNNQRALSDETVANEVTFPLDGQPRHFFNIIRPIKEDGRIVGILGINIDITDRVLAEQEQQRLREQFMQAQKLEAVGRLAGGVAHDMNNILTSITGIVSLMEAEEPTGTSRRREFGTILQACTQARDMIQNLLGFARRGKVLNMPLSLNDSVNLVSSLLRRTISKGIQIQTRLAPDLRMVHGDASQMSQLLMNLAINGIDAMGNEGTLQIVTLNLDLDETGLAGAPDMAPGRYVLLQVTDTGSGMDENIMHRAFEPFFSTKPQNVGTGLGLSMAYGAVKNHGGEIWLRSGVAKGTTVFVCLPMHEP